MNLVGGPIKDRYWPLYHNGGVFEYTLWFLVLGWPSIRVASYFVMRMQPPYPGINEPTLVYPTVWVAWIVLTLFAGALTVGDWG